MRRPRSRRRGARGRGPAGPRRHPGPTTQGRCGRRAKAVAAVGAGPTSRVDHQSAISRTASPPCRASSARRSAASAGDIRRRVPRRGPGARRASVARSAGLRARNAARGRARARPRRILRRRPRDPRQPRPGGRHPDGRRPRVLRAQPRTLRRPRAVPALADPLHDERRGQGRYSPPPQADPTPKTFAQLARDHSQDKATALRSGNLGFLTADGTSSEPGLRVDPAIVRASRPCATGTSSLRPWSKASSSPWSGAAGRSRPESAPSRRSRRRSARSSRGSAPRPRSTALVASLRTAKVRDLHEELLDAVDLSVAPDASRAP